MNFPVFIYLVIFITIIKNKQQFLPNKLFKILTDLDKFIFIKENSVTYIL